MMIHIKKVAIITIFGAIRLANARRKLPKFGSYELETSHTYSITSKA